MCGKVRDEWTNWTTLKGQYTTHLKLKVPTPISVYDKQNKNKNFPCCHCNRRFGSNNSVYGHIWAEHVRFYFSEEVIKAGHFKRRIEKKAEKKKNIT